jgi:hypothetical protein
MPHLIRKTLIAAVLVIAAGSATALPADISSDAILRHVRFLSSDEMKGRANGTPELERAAEYIAEQFRDAGLDPGIRGEWRQPFELIAGLAVGRENRVTFEESGRSIALELGSSYYPLGAPANENPGVASTRLDDLPVVFAGFGLVVPSIGYDDYGDLDVNGKVALIFSHEPQEDDARSRLNGARPVPQTTLQAKAATAMNRGARALIVVGDPSHARDEANYRLFGLDPDADDTAIPVLRARRTEMQPLIDAWGLDRIAREIDADLKPRSKALAGVTVDYVEYLARNRRTVGNVVAVLPGSDRARADEAIVIGAHYDHVGVGGRLSVTPDRTGEIHNGADDNASGTAAIIEMARAARQDRGRFPRTLVFIAFAGEERGLLGSAHYVNDPAVPVNRTIAMLNLDMVGRARGGVDISGLEASPSIEADLRAARQAARSGLDIRRQGPGAGRSDDSSFINRRIPAINFFTGFHNDYHRPGDDWEKVDAEGTARIAELALELAASLAARPGRPEFVEGK